MKLLSLVLLSILLGTDALHPKKTYSSPTYTKLVKFFTETLPNSPHLMKLWEEHLQNYTAATKEKRAPPRYPIPNFDCDVRFPWNGTEATSVHELHPGDIKVIAAMGDSLTAGNGIDAWTVIGALTEYRGLSWSVGGQNSMEQGVLTMPNILKKFRSDLYGYSTGSGSVSSSRAKLNVADPGDTSYSMPGQAVLLVDRMRADPQVDFDKDWKLITLFIGGNDLCDYCHDSNKYSAANYGTNIRMALDYLHTHVPRAFVNLALIFDIAPVAALSSNIFCDIIHYAVCDCGHNPNNAEMLRLASVAYQRELENIIGTGRYDTNDDFTVVIQPFFKDTVPPSKPGDPGNIDMTFFCPDCFHFSAKGHGAAALSLWNNMLESVGHKEEDWHLYQPFLCPGTHEAHDHWYFTTAKNYRT